MREWTWKDTIKEWLPVLLAVFIAALSGTGVAIVITDDDPTTPDTTVPLPPLKGVANQAPDDGHPDATVKADPVLVQAFEENLEKDLAQTAPVSEAARELAEPLEKNVKALPGAGAVQGFSGCQTRILPVNYSSRNGARALVQVDHYTVSFNVAGWGDMNAIWNLFANPARQASSNFIIDSEGHCYYIVPIENKAWTQAGGNPWSISYEIIAFGNEANYLGPDGWAKLRSVQRQVASRTGIPLRRGAVSSSCVPITTGIVQHKDFGLCGGGHVDITPFSIAEAVAKVSGSEPVLTTLERKIVASVRRPKGTGHSRGYWCKRLTNQINWLVSSPQQPRHDRRLAILRRVRRGNCS